MLSLGKHLTFGYLESLGQPSIATMILWPASVEACRVSIRMRGIRRSAGVKRWRVDWIKEENKRGCQCPSYAIVVGGSRHNFDLYKFKDYAAV